MTNPGDRDDSTLRDDLATLGLSDSEIDTYLALLSKGEATTSAVAKDTDVTQRAVYNIGERLEDRGLVRVDDHASPTTLRPLHPTEAIGNLTDRLESITPTLADRFNEPEASEPEIQIVKSRETALKRLRQTLSEATHEILVAIPEHVFSAVEAELRAAVDRDVLVFLLIGEMDDSDADADRFTGATDAVRYWDETLPFLYAVDDQTAMIGDASIASGTHSDGEAVTVSKSQLSGAILGMYFSAHWPAATELVVAEPDPLPKSFEWFRHATLEAILHHRAGVDLWADVETVDGSFVSGPVTQINQAFVEPTTNDFTLENSFHIETDDGVVTVGGPGSFLEDYESETIALRSMEE